MVLQNYQNFMEMTSNMIYIVAFGVGLKCPRKIHLNTQCWEQQQWWNRYLLLNVQKSWGQLSPLPLKFRRPWMLVAFDSDFNVMKMFVDDLQLCVRRSSKIKSETCRSIDYFLIIIQNTEISRPWKIVVRAAFWLAHLLTNAQTIYNPVEKQLYHRTTVRPSTNLSTNDRNLDSA